MSLETVLQGCQILRKKTWALKAIPCTQSIWLSRKDSKYRGFWINHGFIVPLLIPLFVCPFSNLGAGSPTIYIFGGCGRIRHCAWVVARGREWLLKYLLVSQRPETPKSGELKPNEPTLHLAIGNWQCFNVMCFVDEEVDPTQICFSHATVPRNFDFLEETIQWLPPVSLGAIFSSYGFAFHLRPFFFRYGGNFSRNGLRHFYHPLGGSRYVQYTQ